MTGRGGSINWRIAMEGSDQVKKDLRDLGPTGKKAADELDTALSRPTSGLRALDEGGKAARQSLDGLAQRAGPVGAALGSLGPLGLAAAAGLAAVIAAGVAALNVTRDAMAFADDVADSATKINVGVEALQEWRLVARALGADTADADEALGGFMKKFGEARSGLSAKAMKPFAALGFTQEELKNVSDGEQLMGEVIERIAGLSNAAEQAAIAEKLGLGALLPVIREGADAIARTREEMRELGVIMDAEMIQRGAEAQAQYETLSTVIDMNLKASFIELAPAIVQIVGLLADASRAGRDFVETFRELDKRSTAKLETDLSRAQRARSELLRVHGAKLADGTAEPTAQAAYKRWNDRIDTIMGEIWERKSREAPPASGGGGRELVDLSGKAEGAKGPSAEDKRKNFEQQRDRLDAAIMNAHANQARSAEDLAVFAEERLKSEHERELKRIAEDKALEPAARATLQARQIELYQAQQANLRGENFQRLEEERYRIAREQLEMERALAAARGDRTVTENLDRTLAGLDRARELARGGMAPDDARQQAEDEQADLLAAERQAEFRDLFKGAFRAALDGDLGGFLQSWLADYTTRGLETALNSVADLVLQLFGSAMNGFGGGGGGGFWGDLAGAALGAFGGGSSASVGGRTVNKRAHGGGFGPGWALFGEEGPELVRMGVSGYAYDAAETRTVASRIPSSFPGGGSAGGVSLTVINSTGVPARAEVSRDSGGGMRLDLRPMVSEAIRGAGRSGELAGALRETPGKRIRG